MNEPWCRGMVPPHVKHIEVEPILHKPDEFPEPGLVDDLYGTQALLHFVPEPNPQDVHFVLLRGGIA